MVRTRDIIDQRRAKAIRDAADGAATDLLGEPPLERSALAIYSRRPPPRSPGTIAVHPDTDTKAVLARVLGKTNRAK